MTHLPRTEPAAGELDRARCFYEKEFVRERYASGPDPDVLRLIQEFVRVHKLERKRVLEVGCGRGWLQDVVADWTGVDLSAEAGRHVHKPFVCAPAERLPFADGSFDCVWSVHVLEHVPGLETALAEVARVIRPGGLALLKPAWFCRPWAAQGYQVRPWRDFEWIGKLVKATIPIRNSLLYRLPGVAARRFLLELRARVTSPTPLHHGRLTPNYEVFWQSDSDACNSIDPHDVILWFVTRGWLGDRRLEGAAKLPGGWVPSS